MTNFAPETKNIVPVEVINNWLKKYGSFDGLQKFRLSFADDQMEKRLGTFSDYDKSTGIFLRTVTEIREVRKYPEENYKGCYLVERLIPNYHTNIPGKLSYEAFWCYDKKLPDGSIKHPTFEAVQWLMIHSQEGPKKSAAFYIDLATKQDEDVLSYYENLFDNEEGLGYKNEVINSEFEVEH